MASATRVSRDAAADLLVINGEYTLLARLRAGPDGSFASLGQTEIPAIVIEATREELMLISLIENLARRNRTTMEHVKEIGKMRENGDSPAEIAGKTGLVVSYVNGYPETPGKG